MGHAHSGYQAGTVPTVVAAEVTAVKQLTHAKRHVALHSVPARHQRQPKRQPRQRPKHQLQPVQTIQAVTAQSGILMLDHSITALGSLRVLAAPRMETDNPFLATLQTKHAVPVEEGEGEQPLQHHLMQRQPKHQPVIRPVTLPKHRPEHRPEHQLEHRPKHQPEHQLEHRPTHRPTHRPLQCQLLQLQHQLQQN